MKTTKETTEHKGNTIRPSRAFASLAVKKVRFMLLALMGLATLPGLLWVPRLSASDAKTQVELNADNIGPRPIEELTTQHITRDYALAWQSLSEALDQNRSERLDDYFTGLAKEKFSRLIKDQVKTGVQVRYVDHGHKLDAIFYSPAGDAMQLRDQARLEIQILDGTKVIHTEEGTHEYLVLMTPGADRWLVRNVEDVPAGQH